MRYLLYPHVNHISVNVGKLIAQVSVLAIVVYCCYGAIVQAVPLDVSSAEEAFQVNDLSVNTSTNGLELTIDFEGSVTSGLPQDVDDVTIGISVGDKTSRMRLTSVDVGTLKAKSTTEISSTSSIPTYALLAYGVDVDNTGTLTIPMILDFTFKYMKWQGTYLVDMGVGVKQDLDMVTGATAPTVKVTGTDATISMTLTKDSSNNSLVNTIVDQLNNSGTGNYNMSCGDAELILSVSGTGSDATLSLKFTGDPTRTAAEIMKSNLETDGKLVFVYDGKNYELEKENAETFISLVEEIYTKGSS